MELEVYLDNSATTKCADPVKDIMVKVLTEDYGNPSSMHKKGVDAERYIRTAKEIIAKNLKVNEKEIIFTSGGTESDNLAIIGTALANRRSGMHIITSAIEHPAVLNSMKHLEEEGFKITCLPVDRNGIVRMDKLEAAVCEETILVSIMHVNNEIGSVQPVAEIAELIKKKNRNVLFHVDAVQGFGKYRILPKKMGIDLLSVSGHKIHGPKGIGFLYVNEKVKIKPLMFGGEQQRGIRSGTENVPGIAGIGEAVKFSYEDHENRMENLYKIKEDFIGSLLEIEDVRINGLTGKDSAPHIVSASFAKIRSEVLLHSLEEKGIYVSSGSACASNKPAISATLKGIGVPKELLDSTIRFSFSAETTAEELAFCAEALKEIVPRLRKYARR
ncbi:cysteine desulfurase [Anaerobium acetethylicum]|uniref:Cysteine desulfurase n=1 Tax=Anaerobium acetethylicum TaxID=1619234 RepID=A0A1D3TQT0_9FIRM|nr:cysteine desulfurase family protein [Anaerobium acetethylicum]SCP95969.1 cysteine desulfurase [Anaerobium acetethylicum]